jgi:hypothetical protein
MLKALWKSVRDAFQPGPPEPREPPDARFVFRHQVDARGGDSFVSVVDQVYRVRLPGIQAEGTFTAEELDAFVRDLEAHGAWSLDDAADGSPQPTCQSWTTVRVRAGARRHEVTYYGLPNPRVAGFETFLASSIVMRRSLRLEAGETIDPWLRCSGCSAQHAAGATRCRHDGNGLVRTNVSGKAFAGFSCASCDAKLPQLLSHVTACPACGVEMAHRK